MNNNRDAILFISLLVLILIFCVTILILLVEPESNFWLSDKEQKLKWCLLNQPEFNISYNPRIRFCFEEGWEVYCTITYTQACPYLNNDTWENAKQRFLQNE